MRLDYFDDLLTYWRALREAAGGAVPRRQQFNPMAIPKLLPHIFILEREGDDRLIVRLAGTALDDATQRPPTGANLLDRYDPVEHEAHLTMYHNLMDQPCGIRLNRLVHVAPDPVREAEVIALPLADREGVVRYAVGVIQMRSFLEDVDKSALHRLNVDYIDLGFGVPL